jgi:hypothetical protein
VRSYLTIARPKLRKNVIAHFSDILKTVYFVHCFEYVPAFARSKCTLIVIKVQKNNVILKIRKHSFLFVKSVINLYL